MYKPYLYILRSLKTNIVLYLYNKIVVKDASYNMTNIKCCKSRIHLTSIG